MIVHVIIVEACDSCGGARMLQAFAQPPTEAEIALAIEAAGGGTCLRHQVVDLEVGAPAIDKRQAFDWFLAGFDESTEGNNGEYSRHGEEVVEVLRESFDQLWGERKPEVGGPPVEVAIDRDAQG